MTTTASRATPAAGLMNRLSIRQQLVGAIVCILLLFGVACVTSIAMFENVHDARNFADQVNTTLMQASELSDAVVRQEGALRGYALAALPRFLQTLSRMQERVDTTLQALADASGESPVQERRLRQIDALEQRWRSTVAEPIIAQVKAGQLDAARDRLIAGDGTRIFDPLRDTLGLYRADIQHQLDQSNAELEYRQQRARWLLLGVLIFGLCIGLLSIRAIVKRVTRPLSELTGTTARLAAGERDVHISFRERQDEIGAVSRALEHFRQIILEQDRQSWIRDNRARLSALMQRCRSARELGDVLLGELVPLCGAGYGAIFTPATLADEEQNFALLSRYGYDGDARQRFAPGEGLVGQVLVSREKVLLDDLPDGYVPIRSGLGGAAPTVLQLAPALVNDRVCAVIEMALFRQPSTSELELLDTLMPHIGLAFVSLARTQRATELFEQGREQTRALLESEQRLRSQQEALETVNAELRIQSEELSTQSEELRASEEELKVQSDELQAINEELRQKHELMSEQQAELSRLHTESEKRAEALARASQYKSDFLANMSHELRTPLNSLLILSRSLADNEQGNLDAEQAEAAQIIHESGSNLLGLINDILDLSKIEAGKMQVLPERSSVSALATRIRRSFAHMAQRKGLAFTVTVDDDVPETLITDAGKLEQIVRNLVSNALKFTERGTVAVVFTRPTADSRFRNAALDADAALAIEVTDDGIGIPADRLEQIFQAFEQVDASTSRTYGGTGLGLSISSELARLLGGEISVESRLGEGSRFTLTVATKLGPDNSGQTGDRPEEPASVAYADVAAPRHVVRDGRTGYAAARTPHLLIIDDDRQFAGVVAEAARKRGFECTTAADGERGLDMIRQQLPDAIVLDLGLPGMDGWAVLDRLKASDRTRDIPVHVVSAADDTGRSRQSGAVGYIQKPISRDDLDTVFARAQVLSGRPARRVLVVDDDREAHTAISHLLKNESVEITAVISGAQALAALDGKAFDCVVLDLRLPDISGFELLERIAAREGAPPVVVYSGRELSVEETRTLRAHTDSIVIKGSHAQERLLDEISLFFHRIADGSTTPTPVAAMPSVVPDADLAGQTVLLVDDDMRNTFALSRLLRARGLKVLMASDGFKALDQLAANDDVALVLMDIMMPGMDGYETMRRIRAQPAHATLPIIALTAKAMAGDRDKCIEAGANDYLPKPLDTDALLSLVRSLI
ncbi:response regulator [Salinisphaera aquimarina]|uniref:histidine kinase n=1 Tax=Salinisphaera aquimarina TaxID=2094031 RepID=A0ABV7EV53_9GAMM